MTARVKIFFLVPSLVQGGAERQVLELISRLPQRFEPVLALWRDEIYYRDKLPAGQPRYILGTRRMTRQAFRRLVEILRAERPTSFTATSTRRTSGAAWRRCVRRCPSSCRPAARA